MAIMDLVLYPDEPLRAKAEPFDDIGPEVAKLAEDMFETMYTYDGVGLAGPQVGIAKQIVVLHEPDGKAMCLINPEIYEAEGQELGEEGCLSLPDLFAPVERALHIRVRALNPQGKKVDFEASKMLARIVQHETDHLKGLCFVDRLDILTRQDKLQDWQEIRRMLEEEGG